MGWFSSFGSNKVPSNHIEQRSHESLNLSNLKEEENPNIARTLSQLSDSPSDIKLKELYDNTKKENQRKVTEFVNERPKNIFTIDGEKDVDESIICTSNENGGKTCLKMKMNSIELFKQMQTLDYFCALPDNMRATYFECRKIT
ncbi:Piso0_000823 [Millerozyma farinosa CBS 7064]|uniref:Piso0_000823 protein n=1 Tax=Pichia sorbitophila (strain ATCC MYA-4447 / BCRC 22081 / CBS 7064 / NBRC 10061 / NRRL Y-12695) TaxID=559304 RepID=G8YQ59_PICSO|nr:Piso0_000823 [Millerozyma farinosa CBS 7064]